MRITKRDIIVDGSIGSAVCVACGIGLVDGLRTFQLHCLSKHSMKFNESKPVYQDVWKNYDSNNLTPLRDQYLDKIQSKELKILPQIQPLPVYKLYKCPICPDMSVSSNGVKSHLRRHHGDGCLDTSSLEQFTGQCFYSKKDWKSFWVIGSNNCESYDQEGDEEIADILQCVSNSSGVDKDRRTKTKDRSVFANLTNLDKKLEKFGISWELALELTRSFSKNDVVLFEDLVETLKEMHNNFFSFAKEQKEIDCIYRHPERVMRAISMPGVSSKTKVFRFLDETSEDNYRRRSFQLILFSVRIWCLKAKNDPRVDGFQIGPIISEQIRSLIVLSKKLMNGDIDINFESDTVASSHSDDKQLPNYACSDHRKLKVIQAKIMMKTIQAIMYEVESLNNQSTASLISIFNSCLGITQVGDAAPPQLSLGKHISHTLVSVGYATSIAAYLSISQFPIGKDSERELQIISKRHEPGGNLGMHITQELLAKTTMTRRVEESHGSWRRCTSENHKACGFVYGKHISAIDVGKVVMEMQKDFFNVLFSDEGPLQNTSIPIYLLENINDLKDDIPNEEAGFSFLKHPKNMNVVRDCENIVKSCIRKFLKKEESSKKKTSEALKMLKKIKAISVMLQTILQLSGGVPGRGREVCFQRIRNTIFGGRRACFLSNNDMIMIPGYTKTTAMAINSNLVSRHPDHVSAFIYKFFFLFVVPYRRGIVKFLESGGKNIIEENCCYDYIIIEEKTRNEGAKHMAKEWMKYGLDLSHMEYRQWHGGYGKEKSNESQDYANQIHIMEGVGDGIADGESDQNNFQLQAGHSIRTAQIHYGRDANGLAKNGCLDESFVEKFRRVSEEWHEDTGLKGRNPIACGILSIVTCMGANRHPCDKFLPIVRNQKEDERLDLNIVFQRKVDRNHLDENMQPSHSKVMKRKSCDRKLLDESKQGGLVRESVSACEPVQKKMMYDQLEEIEHVEHFGMEVNGSMSRSSPRASLAPIIEEGMFQDENAAIDTSEITSKLYETQEEEMMKKALQYAIGMKEVFFRSQTQKQAMRQILRRDKDILVVDRTGGGKTALISGPVSIESGVSIVVVPLRALQNSMQEKLSSLKITVRNIRDKPFWESIPTNGVIIVSPEDVGKSNYRDAFAQINATGRLLRVYVDEVHEFFLSSCYRDCMKEIWKVRQDEKIPLVMLSATVPPSIVNNLFKQFRVRENNICTVRGDLRRENVAIIVENLEEKNKEFLYMKVCMKLGTIFESHDSKGRYIIATLTKADTEMIHTILNNHHWNYKVTIRRYHGSIDNVEARNLMKEWCTKKLMHGEKLVMVATEAFSVGIDAELVQNVIVAGSSRSLFNFCQTLGRCGRNNERSRCFILFNQSHSYRSGGHNEDNHEKQKQFDSFVQSKTGCLKLYVERFMGSSSAEKPCLERSEDIEKCSNCVPIKSAEMADETNEKKQLSYWRKVVDAAGLVEGIDFSTCNDVHMGLKGTHIDELRKVSRCIMQYCVPCCFRDGSLKLENCNKFKSGKHGRGCLSWRCLRCMAFGHDAAQCKNIESITAGCDRRACRWCFLQKVSQKHIHEGINSRRNEYGSKENCPYQNIVGMAFFIWTVPSIRQKLIADGYVSSEMTMQTSQKNWCTWLTEDSFSSPAGILKISSLIRKLIPNEEV